MRHLAEGIKQSRIITPVDLCVTLLLLNFTIKLFFFFLVLALYCWLGGVTVCPKSSSLLTTPLLTQGIPALETTLWFSP